MTYPWWDIDPVAVAMIAAIVVAALAGVVIDHLLTAKRRHK